MRAGAAVLAMNAATRGVRPAARPPVGDLLAHRPDRAGPGPAATTWGGPAASASPTPAPSCTTSAPPATAGSRSAGAEAGSRPGARLNGRVEVDPEVAAETHEHLVVDVPGAARACKVTHAWGGPIDVSPSHLPQIGTLDGGPVHYAFGFTGNGVGPSHLAGRALAALATGEPSPLAVVDPSPVRVPPEPFAFAGGSLVRRAFLRKERLEEESRAVDPLTRLVTAAPRALGIHVGR